MKIVIDGSEVPFEEGMPDKIDHLLKEKNRVITSILVNNAEMVNASLEEIFAGGESERIIQIETCTAEELIMESLGNACEYIPRLREGLLNIRDRVLAGDTQEAGKMLEAGLEGIEWLLLSLQALAGTKKHPDMETVLEEEKEKLNAAFPELESAMKDDDMILICDILEYEVIPFLEKMLPLIESINAAEE